MTRQVEIKEGEWGSKRIVDLDAPLTKAQREVLEAATRDSQYKKSGEVVDTGLPWFTLRALEARGLIEEVDHYDPVAERSEAITAIDAAKAKASAGDWAACDRMLADARSHLARAERKMWVITAAGRAEAARGAKR
jgi:hypothetical protein